jgi:DNA-binding response OmpR family regulator
MQQHVSPDESETGKVLIVDDEEDEVLLFESYLNSKYDVVTATSGPKALQKIDDSVDVVLLDRRMPDMSGDEVLGILREDWPDVQIAMVTGVKPSEEVMDMAFDDYITKPVDESEIVGLVDTLMMRRGYHRASQRFFRLVAKKTALEEVEKTNTGEYAKIVKDLIETRDEIEEILNTMTPEEVVDVSDDDLDLF